MDTTINVEHFYDSAVNEQTISTEVNLNDAVIESGEENSAISSEEPFFDVDEDTKFISLPHIRACSSKVIHHEEKIKKNQVSETTDRLPIWMRVRRIFNEILLQKDVSTEKPNLPAVAKSQNSNNSLSADNDAPVEKPLDTILDDSNDDANIQKPANWSGKYFGWLSQFSKRTTNRKHSNLEIFATSDANNNESSVLSNLSMDTRMIDNEIFHNTSNLHGGGFLKDTLSDFTEQDDTDIIEDQEECELGSAKILSMSCNSDSTSSYHSTVLDSSELSKHQCDTASIKIPRVHSKTPCSNLQKRRSLSYPNLVTNGNKKTGLSPGGSTRRCSVTISTTPIKPVKYLRTLFTDMTNRRDVRKSPKLHKPRCKAPHIFLTPATPQ